MSVQREALSPDEVSDTTEYDPSVGVRSSDCRLTRSRRSPSTSPGAGQLSTGSPHQPAGVGADRSAYAMSAVSGTAVWVRIGETGRGSTPRRAGLCWLTATGGASSARWTWCCGRGSARLLRGQPQLCGLTRHPLRRDPVKCERLRHWPPVVEEHGVDPPEIRVDLVGVLLAERGAAESSTCRSGLMVRPPTPLAPGRDRHVTTFRPTCRRA